jgi:hypothetical protein
VKKSEERRISNTRGCLARETALILSGLFLNLSADHPGRALNEGGRNIYADHHG